MAKILSLVPYKIFPALFGGQRAIALFNEYLAKETELVCITVKSNDPSYAKGYTVLNQLPDSPVRYLNPLLFFTLRDLIRQQQVTHLMLEHPYFGWLGLWLKKQTGVKLIVRSHNIESLRWKGLGKWWWKILWHYERAVHRGADYNFFITDQDKDYAIRQYRVPASTCTTVTYGIGIDHPPLPEEKAHCRESLCKKWRIGANETLFLFNGALGYRPNYMAVEAIVKQINPVLMQQGLAYKIIICGQGLPVEMNELKDYAGRNIIYAGFVDDIALYFKGADLFLNPVTEGGGIKTKLIEALSYNLNAVSTENGAFGVDPALTGRKLVIVENHDWSGFAKAAVTAAQNRNRMPPEFYRHFFWGSIARKAVRFAGAL